MAESESPRQIMSRELSEQWEVIHSNGDTFETITINSEGSPGWWHEGQWFPCPEVDSGNWPDLTGTYILYWCDRCQTYSLGFHEHCSTCDKVINKCPECGQ